MPKLWLLIRFKIIGIVSAAVSAVIAIGLGLYSFSGLSPQAVNEIPLSTNPVTSSSQNVDSSPSPGNLNIDQTTVNRLVAEEGLDNDTATIVSQINTQFKTSNNTYLNYEQILSDKEAWDVQIKAIPDQTYIPTDAELETAAATGREIYDVSYSFEEIDGIPQFSLRYFVPYEAMSEELKTSIQSNPSSPAVAGMIGFLPSAEASGGATGAVFETIVKSLAKEGISKLGDFSNLFAALDIATGAYKVSQYKSYFSELDQLRECAENPTNPLTKKTYQENPSEKAKAIDQIDEAKSQVEQLTTVRLLNLAAKTGSKFIPGVNFAGKLFFDSVAKWSDETLKEVAEGWIDDAKKGVVECEPAAIGLKGSIQYTFSTGWASTLYEPCDGGRECFEVKEQRSGSGDFFVWTRGSAVFANGTGTFEQTRTRVITKPPSDPLTEYSGEYNLVVSGDVRIEGMAGRITEFPLADFTINAAALLSEDGTSTRYILNYGDSKVTAVTDERHSPYSGGFLCHFKDVDLVKGGTYEVATDVGSQGGGVGSCKLELFPG